MTPKDGARALLLESFPCIELVLLCRHGRRRWLRRNGRLERGRRRRAVQRWNGNRRTGDDLIDGHRDAVQIFVERNGCMEATALQPSWCDGLDADNQSCTCVEYQGCSAGYPVIECEYNAGHVFAPNSGQTLWDFFSQF